jgi:hypothetical protein
MRSRVLIPVASGALLASALAVPSASAADPSTDGLVITEYVEGSGFNKAIEIYNGSGASADLVELEFRLYSNGRPLAEGPTATHAFDGELADGDVYVLTHPDFDTGLGLGGDVDATSQAVNFNGNDAFLLFNTATGEVVDSVGQAGESANYAADVTLRRTDLTRDTAPDDPFTLDAFDSHPRNTVDQLGVYPDGSGGTDPGTCDSPDEDLTLISEVQGSNIDPALRFDSPLDGQTRTVRAVVTMADSDLDGYFVQEEPADHDNDPMSSEGLFVHQPGGQLPNAGETVELTGRVTAFFGLTQFSEPETAVCDVPATTIEPTPISLPVDGFGREALESMLVATDQDLAVSGLFAAYRFGELGLAHPDLLTQPTSIYAPGDPAAMELYDANAASFLKVNDRNEASSQFNPFPWELFNENLSAGDIVPAGSVVGPLNFSFDEFKIEPLNDRDFPEVEDADPRADVPALADGNDVAAFNVLNYFNTFGDSDVLRGAQNQEEFEKQTAKIVDAILQMDASVLGLIEIENDYEDYYDDDPDTVPSVQTLVEALNAEAGEGTYDWVVPNENILTTEGLGGGGLGTDAIAQALIYQPSRAVPVGPARTLDIDSELTGDQHNSRWPLAQTFKIDRGFATVVVNHLKSKGSTCEDTAGPGFGLGDDVETTLTGNCNLTRTYAAQRLVDWVADGATPFPTAHTLLIGDFNSYEEEDPIEVLVDAGFTDLVQEFGDDAFTYKFDGRYGRLDYAFASPSLAAKVTDAEVWQINSRAPYGHLYNNDPVDDTAYASSDHDPVLVSLKNCRPGRPGGGGRN